MKDTAQEKQPARTTPAAQRQAPERGGHLSAQLASSPRQLAQRRLIGQMLGSAVQRVEGALGEEEGGATQLRSEPPVQQIEGGLDEEKEPPAAAQLRAEPAQRQENRTGMPDGLKAGIESLSGMDMSGVRVHRNSSAPAQLNALAYAQGNDIHLGPGQEQHLPHEAWHVVQQRQGRVQATMQMAGVGVNDDVGLEREADVMGGRAVQWREGERQALTPNSLSGVAAQCVAEREGPQARYAGTAAIQLKPGKRRRLLEGSSKPYQEVESDADSEEGYQSGFERNGGAVDSDAEDPMDIGWSEIDSSNHYVEERNTPNISSSSRI
jgi:hypothetical protein